jgi:hypothetical protein
VLGASGIAIGGWMFARGPKHAQVERPQPSPAVATAEPAVLPTPGPPSPALPTPGPSVQPAPVHPAPAPAKTVAVVPKTIAVAPRTTQTAPKKQTPIQPAPPPQALAPSGASTVAAIKATQTARTVASSGHHYCRSCMVASMDMFCRIPIDPAHVTGQKFGVADWGKVIKVEDELGEFRDEQITETVITVQGQRDTYRIDAEFLDEQLSSSVGDWLALCVEDQNNNIYGLSGGPTWRTHSVITISGPPRVGEIAKLDPIHIPEIKMVAEGLHGEFKDIDPARRYLIRGEVKAAAGGRWLMDRYTMQVPAGIPGGKLIAAGKRLWFVVDHLRFEADDTGKNHLVVDAAYVIDDLFP